MGEQNFVFVKAKCQQIWTEAEDKKHVNFGDDYILFFKINVDIWTLGRSGVI